MGLTREDYLRPWPWWRGTPTNWPVSLPCPDQTMRTINAALRLVKAVCGCNATRCRRELLWHDSESIVQRTIEVLRLRGDDGSIELPAAPDGHRVGGLRCDGQGPAAPERLSRRGYGRFRGLAGGSGGLFEATRFEVAADLRVDAEPGRAIIAMRRLAGFRAFAHRMPEPTGPCSSMPIRGAGRGQGPAADRPSPEAACCASLPQLWRWGP